VLKNRGRRARVGAIGLLLQACAAAQVMAAPQQLSPDASGVTTILVPGHYVNSTGAPFKTIVIGANGVRLEGLKFNGGGSASAAVKSGLAGLSNVTIDKCSFEGYSDFLVSAGLDLGTTRGVNWVVKNNVFTLGGDFGSTAITLAYVDGAEVSGNKVSVAQSAGMQMGIALAASTHVKVSGNTLTMSSAPVQPDAGIALAAIDIATEGGAAADISIEKNIISGAYYGVREGGGGHGQTKLKVYANTISATEGVALNARAGNGRTIRDVTIGNNKMTVGTFGVNLVDGPNTQYVNVLVSGNTITRTSASGAVISDVTAIGAIQTNVVVKSNKLLGP
jgi:hypothetical protein